MKRELVLGTVVGTVFVMLLYPAICPAAAVSDLPVFALHTRTPPAKTGAICGVVDPVTEQVPCDSYSVSAPVQTPMLVYMVVGNVVGDGVTGVSFGVDYSLGHTTAWHLCIDGLDFPNDGGNGDFPAPLGGLRATWYNCQDTEVGGLGVQAVIGSLYLYAVADDVVEITPNNNLTSGPELDVSYCVQPTVHLLDELPVSELPQVLGKVQFGAGSEGFNPCLSTPVKPTTWGKVKTLYGSRD